MSDPGIRTAPAGSPGKFPQDVSEWFREHQTAVFRYVRFRVATREAPDDVTSSVFKKALPSFDRYNEERASPRTWLLRIARSAVTDHLRALKRRGSLHVSLDRIPDLVPNVPSAEERVIRQERIQRLLNGSQELRSGMHAATRLKSGSDTSRGRREGVP